MQAIGEPTGKEAIIDSAALPPLAAEATEQGSVTAPVKLLMLSQR